MRRLTLILFTLAATSGVLAAVGGAQTTGGSGWSANATAFRGSNGTQYVYTCPKYGAAGSLWGTDTYTDDSSVCTAAVHAGLITLAGGGSVTIEIRPGASSYTGSTRNRITSSSYGAWSGSYVFVGATPQDPGVGTGGDGWSANAGQFRTFVGARFLFNCPRGGPPGTVWGTDIYTDDSSVCTAAVHAGLITVKGGGKVTIEMLDGQQSYRRSKRYGITSNPYGPWGGSYFIVGAPGGPDDPNGFATGNVLVNGKPFTSGVVKYGATVDVTGGTLTLSAKGAGTVAAHGDGTDLARFVLKKSVEKVGRKKRITAELGLTGGDFTCPAGASVRAAAKTQKVVRALWASGKGRFRTKGRYAAATIRGTEWETIDRCDGTLTLVKSGTVVVRDLVKKKNVTVSAPNTYLAAAP